MGQSKWLACLKSRFSAKSKSKHKESLGNDTGQASASTPLKESNQSFDETTRLFTHLPLLPGQCDQVNASHDGLLYIIAKLPWYAHLVELLKSEIWQSPQQFRQSKAPLKEAIIELYRLIIEFQILTLRKCHHKFRTLSKTFVGLGSSSEDRLIKIQEAESEVQKHMEIDFRTQVLDTLKGIRSNSAQMETSLTSELNRQFALRQQSKLIAKFRLDKTRLDIDSYQAYYEAISNPSSGTTEGFREHRVYREWRSGSTRSLLVVANPGTGKSVLTKSLHESLSKSGGPAVCSFFFKDRGGQQNNMNVALCHIMYQLFQNRPDWIVHVADDIRNKDPGDIRSNFSFLRELFHKVLDNAEPDGIVVLLDALDENEQCQEFLSSDIQCVAGQRLKAFIEKQKIEDESVCCQLREKLTKRVEGDRTYLFVKLLFDILDKKKLGMTSSVRAWVKEFENIPESVFDAYTELLDAIDGADREAVKAMLEIVLAAQRPLTVEEMEIALKVGMDDEAFEPGDEFNPILFKADMLERCHFLLVTYDDRIYFIHQTVKDYLPSEQESQVKPKKDKRPAWLQSISTVSCHETILNSCMRYISAPFNQRSEIIPVEDFFHLPRYEQLEHQQWYCDTFPLGECAFCQCFPSEVEARLFQSMVQLGSTNMTEALGSMCEGLIMRFIKFSSLADLTCAMEIIADVAEQTPEGDPKLGQLLINLSRAHYLKYLHDESTGNEPCNTALNIIEGVLQVTPIGSVYRARALHARAVCTRQDDIDQAIQDTEEALIHTPDLGQSDKQMFCQSLALHLGEKYWWAETPNEDDLLRAVEIAQEATNGMSKKHPNYSNALLVLSRLLLTASRSYPDKPNYLNQAIEVAREANKFRLPTEFMGSRCLIELSQCLISRFLRDSDLKDLQEARELTEEGLRTTPKPGALYSCFMEVRDIVMELEADFRSKEVWIPILDVTLSEDMVFL
ncbi:hypothetical protein BO85DRAFT_440088 [Aspergillus piperis CBS 112811]|uniref:NACHT domain-containing protein n=1 Tax=Aspergillus piperis CBS 112811 TaxID=1448313 RepID=A0A8G1QY16_9EURO|nr:hypothetical protein BO85DRAFT_440088 [Aspergillus piperis CBS 112811]RAH55794.1 hypothetical protein BO85DRAFT_440088 [Aspergillus piperis CBS 112811]